MKEVIIESKELASGDRLEFGRQHGELEIYGGLSSPISRDTIVMSEKHRKQIEVFAAKSISNYGEADSSGGFEPEATMVQEKLGVPSLMTRVDCTVNENGDVVPYELEDSPSGMGIVSILHENAGESDVRNVITNHFLEHLGELPFVIVSGQRKHGTDDQIIFGESNYFYQPGTNIIPDELMPDMPVIVKAIPGSYTSVRDYLRLRQQSACTMTSEGDKSYGERVGILRAIRNADNLLRDDNGDLASQVLKRRVGSMAMGVTIHLNLEDRQRLGKKGTTTASAIRRHAHNHIACDGFTYVQPFSAPVRVLNPENRINLILRMFTAIQPPVDGETVKAKVLGGCFVARPEMIVHGATNSVNGVVLV